MTETDYGKFLPQDYKDEDYATDDFTPIPAGDYDCVIESVELVQTRRQDGHMLKLMLRVVDTKFEGRMLFDHILLEHPNPEAVEIGRKRIAALRIATGVTSTKVKDLLGKTIEAKVKVEPERDGYDASNSVRWYRESSGSNVAPSGFDDNDIPF